MPSYNLASTERGRGRTHEQTGEGVEDRNDISTNQLDEAMYMNLAPKFSSG